MIFGKHAFLFSMGLFGLSVAAFIESVKPLPKAPKQKIQIISVEKPNLETIKEENESEEIKNLDETKKEEEGKEDPKEKENLPKFMGPIVENTDYTFKGNFENQTQKRLYFQKECYRRARELVPIDPSIFSEIAAEFIEDEG